MTLKNKIKPNRQSLILLAYDLLIATFVYYINLFVYLTQKNNVLTTKDAFTQMILCFVFVFVIRYLFKIYRQVWRYGDVQCYLRFVASDIFAMVCFYIVERIFPIKSITFNTTISIFTTNTLITLTMRIAYRYCYKYGNSSTEFGKALNKILTLFSFGRVEAKSNNNIKKIPIAIVGAGKLGSTLAQDLLENQNSLFVPRMFLESNVDKQGRQVLGIDIYSENVSLSTFEKNEIQEVIFTVPNMDVEKRKELYQKYKDMGLRVKTYEAPTFNGEKQKLREFDPEELLFRKPIVIIDKNIENYYKNKIVLITGGGGSIGSEMARQLAKMSPKKIVLLDIYENGVYDVCQELKIKYKNKIDIAIEICSITNKIALQTVFQLYKPNIVIMAAAHKHVPLMEHNVIEAVYNNVFGTLNTVEVSKEYKVDRVIMVSTDKAVNPTNVMGATKRMCEMIVKTYSELKGETTYSMTRFGNVLGSAGSVIPLFKKQINVGGPITLTDKRIIRYFMTIPEASQLVLKSGAMAKNGELFVLDMGEPVKIIDLAESMIRLAGLRPYADIDIQEIGLRPGEKLYEELLINTDTLEKTNDKLIFIEKDKALSKKELDKNLDVLLQAIRSQNEQKAKNALKQVVPTFITKS